MATKEIIHSQCVECGALYEHHPQSGIAFCPVCNWLAEDTAHNEDEEEEY
jgi:hypothetical protein